MFSRGILKVKGRMRGYIENISPTSVKGWAWDDAIGKAPRIRALLGKKVVCVGEPNVHRGDVCKALNLPDMVVSGFLLPVSLETNDIDKIVVQASSDGSRWFDLPKVKISKPSGSYQDFDGDGASKSYAKLVALKLNELNIRQRPETSPFKGKRVLDIGCNEGFFCAEATKHGASRVLGVDTDSKWIERARRRVPDAEFLNASWWDIPNEKFDIILFLSAIHYEPEQKKLLRKLTQHLTDDGVLILECGVKGPPGKKQWHLVPRWDGLKRYPSPDLLREGLLADYAVRWIGPSVPQKGDPVPRFVLHCRPRRSVAMIIAGRPLDGKTALARSLQERGIPFYDSDSAIARLLTAADAVPSLAAELIEEFGAGHPHDIGRVGNYISENNLVDEFCEMVASEIPSEVDVFSIEGEIFCHGNVRSSLINKLKDKGILVWVVERET